MQTVRHRIALGIIGFASFALAAAGFIPANARAFTDVDAECAACDTGATTTIESDGVRTEWMYIGPDRDFGKGPAGP